ncbi:hypothetical protein WICMUC_001760 [Wickerhamomyces mucosus]|uniref:Uncharacterized protein n=1 Tax=Wickerhamomyces mucosus TaxID=1378264 RepID=A0A9P8TFS4_9ASCO|nr:hypothetical protein WICMUC_001760 [Wickerhamomyces mucosus]
MTKFTKLTAFSEIFHKAIVPPILIKIIETVNINTNEDLKDPSNIVEFKNMIANAIVSNVNVNLMIEVYWTKKI